MNIQLIILEAWTVLRFTCHGKRHAFMCKVNALLGVCTVKTENRIFIITSKFYRVKNDLEIKNKWKRISCRESLFKDKSNN